MARFAAPRFGRRVFARGAAVLLVGGCAFYKAESGVAYEPWDEFPGDSDDPVLRMVHAAILAASPHNTQPWLFRVASDRVQVWADIDRNLGPMDPLRREMFVGLGCALENLVLAARAEGFVPEVELFAEPDEGDLVASIGLQPGIATEESLYAAIPHRHTNRGAYADLPLPGGVTDALGKLIDDIADVRLLFVPGKGAFRRGTIDATKAIIDDDAMLDASEAWFRHSLDDITEHRDGVTIDAAGLGAGTRFFGKSGNRPSKKRNARFWLNATEGRQTTASAFGILSTPALQDRAQAVRVGRAWQRIHLWLTANGLQAQPLNQMAERRDREVELGLAPVFGDALRQWTADDHAQMLFRIGLAWDDAFSSPRRPTSWVVEDL